MQALPPGKSINLARDDGNLPVERLLGDAPKSDEAFGDIAAIATQCADDEAVRRKSAEAPYYHRRRKLPGDFGKLLFEHAQRALRRSGAAHIKCRKIAEGSEAHRRLQRPGYGIEIAAVNGDKGSTHAQLEIQVEILVGEDFA